MVENSARRCSAFFGFVMSVQQFNSRERYDPDAFETPGLENAPSAVNYEMLFDRRVAQSYYGKEPEPVGQYYDDERGLFIKTEVDGGPFVQDLIQFEPDAFAFTGAGSPSPIPQVGRHLQVVGDDDWIHFCLRLGSGGMETISNYAAVDHPSRVCMVTRYPAHTEIERVSAADDRWRIACLWLRPRAVLRFLETTKGRVPEQLSWLTDDARDSPSHAMVPLDARMSAAVNDMLSCQFKGGVRRAFVKSKYLEILATTYQAMLDQALEPDARATKLSTKDEQQIATVADVVSSRLDVLDSLANLARRVGMNRTKMTAGFRAVYGSSIETYWQDLRMQRANDLLRQDGSTVTEVAFCVGYSEISSFTRAFIRKFGVSPSSCKRS